MTATLTTTDATDGDGRVPLMRRPQSTTQLVDLARDLYGDLRRLRSGPVRARTQEGMLRFTDRWSPAAHAFACLDGAADLVLAGRSAAAAALARTALTSALQAERLRLGLPLVELGTVPAADAVEALLAGLRDDGAAARVRKVDGLLRYAALPDASIGLLYTSAQGGRMRLLADGPEPDPIRLHHGVAEVLALTAVLALNAMDDVLDPSPLAAGVRRARRVLNFGPLTAV